LSNAKRRHHTADVSGRDHGVAAPADALLSWISDCVAPRATSGLAFILNTG
jgi:hypothetical protein